MLLRNVCVACELINGVRGMVNSVEVASISKKVQTINVLFDNHDCLPSTLKRNDGSVSIPLCRQEYIYEGRCIIREAFPLTPCWAATIHKVQSLSLPAAVMCLDSYLFQHGMGYVALSRVTRLDAVYITGLASDKLTADPAVVKEYLRLYSIAEINAESYHNY